MEGTIGQVMIFAGNFAPRSWAFCQGQLLSIAQNTALFSVLGTVYGGDGRTTFGLPDMRGRTAIGSGNGPGLTPRVMGQRSGQESVTLNVTQIPQHNHSLLASDDQANKLNPAGSHLGRTANPPSQEYIYEDGSPTLVPMNPNAIGMTGGNLSHENMQPWICMNYVICMFGVYPSRS